ncbi:hypothetical protein QOZ80_3BG0254470 [Eleusine coracana subsp. coracana]|nr:hypothetical protein QOZ80_3BG0254470 [Eleusine coracana subsp. coracana]
MCVYDPMTNNWSFIPFPPDINRDHFRGYVYRYVVLTAGDGITGRSSSSFTVLAVDMAGLLDCSLTIRVQTVSSSLTSSDGAGCQWGPVNHASYEGPPSAPMDGHDAAVVHGGVIHWLMGGGDHILTYDVFKATAGMIELPEDRRRLQNWKVWKCRLRSSSDRKKLTLLFVNEFKVFVREQVPGGGGGWARQATIDVEASVRSLLAETGLLYLKSDNFVFRNFGDQRSGAVLFEYAHYVPSFTKIRDSHHHELLVLDMETKEMRRITAEKNKGIAYEVYLASRLSAMKVF